MILNKKQAQKMGLNHTIDLRSQYFQEELEKTGKYKVIEKKDNYHFFKKLIVIAGFLLFFLTIYLNYFHIKNADAKNNLTFQEKIRLKRIEACAKYAKIEKIYGQEADVRCATFMTIVFAFESNFGKSNLCKNNKNCFGIKGNGIDYPAGFVNFKNYDEANEYFAKKYFKRHYKKKIPTFVNGWSMTDRDSYISFFNQNFTKIYEEILKLKK